MIRHRALLVLLLSASCASSLQGCAALSTGASLQVDVEVYKGPLSLSVPTQAGDALGTIASAKYAFRLYLSRIVGQYPRYGADLYDECSRYRDLQTELRTPDGTKVAGEPTPKQLDAGELALVDLCFDAVRVLDRLDRATPAFERVVDARNQAGTIVTQTESSIKELQASAGALPVADSALRILDETRQKVNDPVAAIASNKDLAESLEEQATQLGSLEPSSQNAQMKQILKGSEQALRNSASDLRSATTEGGGTALASKDHQAVIAATTFLQDRAAFWSTAFMGAPLRRHADRERLVQFTHLSSYYANLLGTRIDLLVKQNGTNRTEAQLLSTSDYLRDESASDYLNLYNWYETSERTTIPGGRAFGTKIQPSPDGLSDEDRIRAARTLFAQRYWSKVNSVFASGQGETRMALVKDDIGNWNLKSFDNNPEELLAAYREATLAGLEAVKKIASSSQPVGKAFVNFTSELARGKVGTSAADANLEESIASIRKDTAASIAELGKTLKEHDAALTKEEADAKAAVDGRSTEATAAADALRTASDQLKRLEGQLAQAQADGTGSAVTLQGQVTQSQEHVRALQAESDRKDRDLADAQVALAKVQEARRAANARAIELAAVELRSHRRAVAAVRQATTSGE
jgi:hypothetical protein